MSTLAGYLEMAEMAVNKLIAECNGVGLRAQMRNWESGLLRALQEAEKMAPMNGTIWRARDWVEQLSKMPHSPVSNSAGNKAGYLSDLRNVEHWIATARQDTAAPVSNSDASAPTNRAAWYYNDWQRNDSAGLQAMMRANTSEWRTLYKRETGQDYTAPTNYNKPC